MTGPTSPVTGTSPPARPITSSGQTGRRGRRAAGVGPVGPGGITPHGLARRSIGAPVLWLVGVSASAPMTVLAGGVVATYATTGVVAVPLSFPLLAAALGLFAVGYTRMSADVPHAATFAALLVHGLGRTAGTAGAAVAVAAYNSVQIALYGLVGATVADQLGGPWWAWALTTWALVAIIGVRGLTLSAPVIAAVLTLEVGMIALFDVVAFTHPAHSDLGAWVAPWRPDLLATGGVGGVLALGVAAFLGFETSAAFGEEARTHRSVTRATMTSLGFLGTFYAISAWALVVAIGPDHIAATAADPGSGIPFSILATDLGEVTGPIAAAAGVVLLIGSILSAMLAFHQVVARYLYALGREHVLPAALAVISTARTAPRRDRPDRPRQAPAGSRDTAGGVGRSGVPIAGSITQSALALAVILLAALSGADPITTVFTGLATLSALGLLTLMTATCLGVIRFYQSTGGHHGRPTLAATATPAAWSRPPAHPTAATPPGPNRPPWWMRTGAPGLGTLSLAAALTVTIASLSATAAVLLPALIAATAALGAWRARWLRRNHRAAYALLGNGQPPPLAVRDPAVADLPL